MKKVAELQAKNKDLKSTLAQYERCAPEKLEEAAEGIKICKQACDRWVDNIYMIVSWIKKR